MTSGNANKDEKRENTEDKGSFRSYSSSDPGSIRS